MKPNIDKKKFRVGIIFNSGSICGESFDTREQADEYILTRNNVKVAKILNRKTKETETIEF